MIQQVTSRHDVVPERDEAGELRDDRGNPAGGTTTAVGLRIDWQQGPLGRGATRKEPNGAFVETVILAAIDRLRWYQQSRFACRDNEQAINHLASALAVLEARTRDREQRGVEGTHQV